MILDFPDPLNIVTDSQYAKRIILHIKTSELIPNDSKLTLLFIQLKEIIREIIPYI